MEHLGHVYLTASIPFTSRGLFDMKAYSMEQLEESFWKRVEKTETCWLWTGAGGGTKGRYGRWYARGVKDFAHRMSYLIHKGAIPTGHIIRHKCHVRKCVNPDHLKTGTFKDNTQDAVRAGRMCSGQRQKDAHAHVVYVGEANSSAVVTTQQVLEIRSLWDKNLASRKMLAEEYGVSHGCIYGITSRKNWSHI